MSKQERKTVSEVATEEEIRNGLVRGLWADFQKPEITLAERLRIATLIEELTADEFEEVDEAFIDWLEIVYPEMSWEGSGTIIPELMWSAWQGGRDYEHANYGTLR
jgi:hypothetical protein